MFIIIIHIYLKNTDAFQKFRYSKGGFLSKYIMFEWAYYITENIENLQKNLEVD